MLDKPNDRKPPERSNRKRPVRTIEKFLLADLIAVDIRRRPPDIGDNNLLVSRRYTQDLNYSSGGRTGDTHKISTALMDNLQGQRGRELQ